jgi:hypothetical protein
MRVDDASGEFHMVHYMASGMSFDKIKRGGGNPNALASNLTELPIMEIRRLLAQGKTIGLMGDRPLGNQFELVPFLGKLAPMDVKPFRVANACGSRLLFTFGFKGEGMTYDFHALPSRRYEVPSGESRALRCYEWAREYARELEKMVRLHPEQWANFYPFWSSVPDAPPDVPISRATHSLWEELHPPASPALSPKRDLQREKSQSEEVSPEGGFPHGHISYPDTRIRALNLGCSIWISSGIPWLS